MLGLWKNIMRMWGNTLGKSEIKYQKSKIKIKVSLRDNNFKFYIVILIFDFYILIF